MSARILVIDDSPTILRVVSAILTRHGYVPLTARDGVSGLEILEREAGAVDLVLLDFVMPKMNGYQFCRALRSNESLSRVGVVLMSAKGDRIAKQFMAQTGALDAITKPFDARALVAVVDGALAKAAQGGGREIPTGNDMPADVSLGDESRSSDVPRRLEQQARTDFARQVTHAVLPIALEAQKAGTRRSTLELEIERALAGGAGDGAFESAQTAGGGYTEVLAGDLAAIPLGEVLQMLEMQKQTGVLRVTDTQKTFVLYMRRGEVDLAQLIGGADEFRLGRYFVERGVLARSDLEEAAKSASAKSLRLGSELVGSGVVSVDDVREALSRQASEVIYEVLRWQAGRFRFTKEPLSKEAIEAELGLRVAPLLLEGFRRMDEWRLMEGTIEWDQVVVVDPITSQKLDASITHAERAVLDLADGERTVNDIVSASELGSFVAVKAIFQFLKSKVLRFVHSAPRGE